MHSAKLQWATPNGEQFIGDMARVSNPANQGADPVKLIGYLIREGHWSPFEMVNLCVEVNTTRTIARQLMRHSPRIQEFSQRYANPSEGLGDFIPCEARMQHPTNRQASMPCESEEVANWWSDEVAELARQVSDVYEQALILGIAKEVARNILPEGLTPSRMYMNGTLRDWLFLTRTRLGHGTQPEAIQVAQSIKEILQEQFPHASEAFFGAEEEK